MSFDDLVLALQRGVDRLVRRFRRGGAPAVTQRRFLIVQIDGLARSVLEDAMAAGHAPFLRDLLRRGGYRLTPMTVGLPTSTPAFQMAAMYGVQPDIPGFHYYDREWQSDVHFPRPGHAAYVERKQAAGRVGILEGGSAYGCVFTGGADNNLFTFSTLTRPSGRGILAALSPFLILIWVSLKNFVMTVTEVARMAARVGARRIVGPQGRRWLTIKVGISVWIRGFFTMAVSRDLYAGTPAIYVNYVDYDEASHAFGPRSRAAYASLRRVDTSIRQLWRIVRRVPEHRYDLYILADHGQSPCRPYEKVAGGQRFEHWIFDRYLATHTVPNAPAVRERSGLLRGVRARSRESAGVLQHYLNYLEEDYVRHDESEASQQGDVRVIAAGPNAFLYVLDGAGPLDADALAARFPGLGEALSRSPGIGFVLARSADGPICYWRGTRQRIDPSAPGPFADRADPAAVARAIVELMAMPSAGDLVIYGSGAPDGDVSFIPERGAHAGPSDDEMQTFVIHPATVAMPEAITHPIQLYEHFTRYRPPS